VDIHAAPSIRDAQIRNAVQTICYYHFSKQEEEEILELQVKQLGGGLSNHLYVVSSSSSETTTSSVLVRIHPPDTFSSDSSSSLINREYENKIMAILSSLHMAPCYYGRFINGRIEQFLEDVRPLRHDEVLSEKFGGEVARALGGLHLVSGIPRHEEEEKEVVEEEDMGEVVGTIEKWMQMAQSVLPYNQKHADLERVVNITSFLEREWEEWLYPSLFTSTTSEEEKQKEENKNVYSEKATSFLRQVVFTHMDCQSLNILTPLSPPNNDNNNTTATVKLIDFEYASHNRRVIDIANTFCGCCAMINLCPNYSKEYPSCELQDDFLRAYVGKVAPALAMELDEEEEEGWSVFLQQARMEVGKHTLISHLLYGVWSIVQWGNEGCDIDFDYVRYAELRMEGYLYFKKRFWGI